MHHARTVVRRAERYVTEIAYQEPVNPAALKYANRVSDLLFVLARYVNERRRADILWRPGLYRWALMVAPEFIDFTSSASPAFKRAKPVLYPAPPAR